MHDSQIIQSRESAYAAGKCVDCRERPRAINKDGQLGRRCCECKSRSIPPTKPVMVRDVIDHDTHFSEWPEFQDYCRQIAKLLRRSRTPLSVADIHRELGRDRVRMTLDALEWLEAEQVPSGSITRYKLIKRESRERHREWNGTPKFNHSIVPAKESYEFRDKQTF